MGRIKLPKTTLDWATTYAKKSWPVFPCHRATLSRACDCYKGADCDRPGKHPVAKLAPAGFKDSVTDPVKIKNWFSTPDEFNIGLRTGNNSQGCLVVIDVDEGEGKAGGNTLSILEAKFGALPPTLVQRTGSGGRHFVFWAKAGVQIKSRRDILCVEAGLPKGTSNIDVRADSGYIIAAPSNHIAGDYYWENWGADIADLPEWLEKALLEPERPARPQTSDARRAELPPDDPNDRLTPVQVDELLRFISPDEYDDWMMFGHVLKTLAPMLGGDAAAFEIWDRWSQRWPEYQARAAATQRDKWESFKEPSLHPINLLRKHAKLGGWTPSEDFQREGARWRSEAVEKMLAALPENATEDDAEPIMKMVAGLPEIRQEKFNKQLAERFKWRIDVVRKQVAKYARASIAIANEETDYGMVVARRVLLKCFDGGKHLIHLADGFWKYNGRFWEQITSENELGNLCMTATLELGPLKKDVAVVVRQAVDNLANLQARAGDPLQLTEPPRSIINCRNGELWISDDFTVELRPHNPDSFLRFCLDIEYDASATCPMFDATLLQIFQDSPEPEDMRRHMMEIYGYAIQPRRFIKIFLIWHGKGGNGKSRLIEVLRELIGKSAVAPGRIQELGHEYNRANLIGKLVYCDDDVDHNTVLPDGILKQYSEAKYSSGRHAYGRINEFVVCVLPIMLCNEYPITKDLTQGTITRAHVVPFRHQFTTGVDLDPRLFERIIKEELAGILNRAIEGLRRVLARGHFLEPKDCVTAKGEFLKKSNLLPAFLDSGFCIRTLEEEIADATSEIERTIEMARKGNQPVRSLQDEIAVAVAKAEKAGVEGICQSTQDFYNNLITWARNEGHTWKPRKSQVEGDLVNLGFPVSNKSGQLMVYRLRSRAVANQTPGSWGAGGA